MDASSAMAAIDPEDPQAGLDQLEEITTTLESVSNPPAEVADDWNTLTSAFRTITDGLSAVVDDPSDADALSEVSDSMSLLTGAEFSNAGQAVSEYTAQNC